MDIRNAKERTAPMIEDAALTKFCADIDAMRAPHFAELEAKWAAHGHGPYCTATRFERGVKFARVIVETAG